MNTLRSAGSFLVLGLFASSPSGAPSAAPQTSYQLPPREILDIVDAPPPPSLRFSPDAARILVVERDALPAIAELSRRMLRLAGMRIDPAANARYRTSYDRGVRLRPLEGDKRPSAGRPLPLPPDARLASTIWSHDSEHFAFTVVGASGSELWAAKANETSPPLRVSERLNTIFDGPEWMPDGATLLLLEVPAGRGPEPPAPNTPTGPNVQATSGDTSPLRTYQDLLASPHDEALFEHYATTEIVLASSSEGTRRVIGAPGIYASVSPSPDGTLLLVERIHRPFSYLMPASRFPRTIEAWSLEGEVVARVAEVPLGENIPIGGVRTGRRSVGWMTGAPRTLRWVEALDGGDPDREAEHRDRWMTLDAPFDGEPREIVRLEDRSWGLTVLKDARRVIAREYDRDRRWVRATLHDLSAQQAEPLVLEDRSIRDRYGDPGSLVYDLDDAGRAVPLQQGAWVYRSGSGASPEGLLPFLDRQNLETLETERLWRCAPGSYESVVDVLATDAGGTRFITRHETEVVPPNYRVRTTESDDVTTVTEFPDPVPQIRGIRKELVTYERDDGVPLSATMYLPADYEEGTRLPLLVWAYPREFNDPATAGQVTSSPSRFTRISGSSHLTLVTQGYAVMDAATMPVIGDPETMNDTFVEQIVAAARAAIDEAVAMGVADPDRVAVGGHSYGAFMTANLLARCDLFRAGIARSGAYNRTLTPFGFQAERRTFWEAPEIYFKVSPFMHADKIDEPLLLIHGEIDNNSGTFPIQSRRMFQAVKGHGGTARLVMLPNESHGYRGRESVLHVQAEMVTWLDEHVKSSAAVEAEHGGQAGHGSNGDL